MTDQKISITPFDEEHVLSDCTVISEAASNDIDKVISTGPLIYIACKGKAVVLDNKDKYACILKKNNDIYSLNMRSFNGQLGISWSQEYHLCDGLLTITDQSTKESMLQMKLCKEILDLVRFFNQPLLVKDAVLHSKTEQRFCALGKTDKERRLFIAFTVRKTLIRVISARDMSRKERNIYESAEKNT